MGEHYNGNVMRALHAHVKGGRLVNESTELPEGEVADLVDGELERLHESLRESIRQMHAGQGMDAVTALDELRAHR